MLAWSDLLIGLLPFFLVSLLLWIRLRAAGVSTKEALKSVAKVFILVAIAISGLMFAVKGWRGQDSLLLVGGTAVAIFCFLVLRWSLNRMWDRSPLPSDGNGQNGSNGN
ncbi:MAG: hypothetical protein N3B10_11320 [Armatimonadetes bacterium]|nr:hypothetical protein [Armatimonadota bacterium]MCX7969057.1 hypothetical protein [Armatimonadota bacterium]MDW8143860.1 hypothetical protein [Armatimonadota bacterium]